MKHELFGIAALCLTRQGTVPSGVQEVRKIQDNSFRINPGMRYAIDFESGLQIVPGLSFPIGIGPSAGEYGMFLHLSFEHPFAKPRASSR
jgi:hypothetical protein